MNNQLSNIPDQYREFLKLSDISAQYRKFSKGQYIGYKQFNEFLDFFEDQDRLSRVMLQGVGIVCGLKPNLIYKDKLLNSIQLSQGVALTTDGDLLTLNNTSKTSDELYVSDLKTINIENKNYTHFKVYDNFKVKYPTFYEESGNQIELWELATAQEANSDFQPINNLSNIEDKYLLLYLEGYEKEVRPCRGVDCDNHGIQQIRNLKVLVTTAQGINHIIENDKVHPHPLFIENIMEGVKQERVILERLISERGIETHFSPSDLKELYSTVLENNDYGKIAFERINAISQIVGMPSVDHQNFKNTLQECLTQKAGFQYAYDVVKDLMDTYSEIIKLLPKAFTQCLPDLVSFPKHVMLGKLVSTTQLDSTRHQFYNSPVLDDEKAMQKVKALIGRFNLQAQNFRYSFEFENESEIKITPSQKSNPLSNKAIPFYYELSEIFLRAWNFDKTSNRSSTNNLGYSTNFLSLDEHIQNPLNFNLDKNSFYTIEGHQGKNCQEVFNQIKQVRDEQQLGFDIMLLSLEELVGNKDMSKAYFNEYVEKHPGLEHKRGVERGGTFIIVYEVDGRDTTVVADFSLPYICCTPKIEAKLSLPSSIICKNANSIPFTVWPLNGLIESNIANNAITKNENGQYFFNPSLVSDSLLNQDITFTVDGKPTNCSIRVVSQPNINIVVKSISHQKGGSNATTVNFTVSGDYFTDYNYDWDFLGNGSFISMKPDAKGNVSHTFYNLLATGIPNIKVNVIGNGCVQNIVLSNWYTAPPIVINSISFPNGNCCEGVIDSPPVTQDNTINLTNRTNTTVTSSNLIYSDPNSDPVTNVRFFGDVSKLYTDSGFTTQYVANTELPISFTLYFKAPDQDAAATYQVQYNVKANGVWSP